MYTKEEKSEKRGTHSISYKRVHELRTIVIILNWTRNIRYRISYVQNVNVNKS